MKKEPYKLVLGNYLVGGESVYGLKTRESDPPHRDKAASVLLPTHAPHTRWYFAKNRQAELIVELAKRISNGWVTTGAFGVQTIEKINKCSRIMNHYCSK